MRLRVRFGQLRFSVDVEDENATLLTLKEAVSKTTCIRDVSEIQISLNGKETIDGDEIALTSHGLVGGDLVYVLSSEVPSLNVDNNKQDVLTDALVNNNTSVNTAVEMKSDKQREILNEGASTSGSSPGNYQRQTEVISNPVFCRDGVSGSLIAMYDTADVKTHHEALLVILHALMLESGFLPKKTSTPDSSQLAQAMPDGWNQKKSTSKFQYMHHLSSSIPCELVVTSLGPFVYAHAWSSVMNGRHYEVKLVVSQYVKGSVPLSAGARFVFQNLHKASRLVKDNLIHPFLANLRHYLGFTSPFSLTGLPAEIQLIIFSQLDARSTLTVTQTCKGLNYISNDQKLWKFFCRRDFGIKETAFNCWKMQYKELYDHKRRHRLHSPHFVLPEPYSGFHFNPFLPQFPPGIIGGPHDIFPDFTLHPNDWGVPPPLLNSRPGFQFRLGQSSSNRLRFPR